MIFVGGVLHLMVVLLPLAWLDGPVLDPATLFFAAAVSALYAGDAVTMRWTPITTRSPRDERAIRWAAATGIILLLLWWACLAERAFVQPGGSWLQLPGAALLVGGVALRASAVHALGRQFRTELDSVPGELVRRGVYRYLRHPSETGLKAASLGAVALLQSELGLVVWCGVLLPVTLARVSLEERALDERFGEAYQRYTLEVGALLPRSRVRRLS